MVNSCIPFTVLLLYCAFAAVPDGTWALLGRTVLIFLSFAAIVLPIGTNFSFCCRLVHLLPVIVVFQ